MAVCLGAAFALGHTAIAGAAVGTNPPQTSSDGLQLVKSSKSRLVYVKPGATLAPYKRVAIIDCDVEFEKNWQKDFNDSKVGLDGRVTNDDAAKIKTKLAAEFKQVFTEELQENGGYQVVGPAAPDVLVLRPALLRSMLPTS